MRSVTYKCGMRGHVKRDCPDATVAVSIVKPDVDTANIDHPIVRITEDIGVDPSVIQVAEDTQHTLEVVPA